MPYKSFEELEVYKQARELRKEIYKLTKMLPGEEKYNLVSQLRRTAVSVTSNIAEGDGRYHYQENIQFCRQARGSISEIIDDLNTCIDEKYCPPDYADSLKGRAYETIRQLNGYVAYLRKRKGEQG
jgi:four helix bundle protein